jgi:hypothetical protein
MSTTPAAINETTIPELPDAVANRPALARKARHSKSKSRNKHPSKSESKLKTRSDSKAVKVLELLKRANGATLPEMIKATGWQIHSIRGFLSGIVKKRLGLKLTSEKAEGKDRRYKIPAKA